MFKKLGTFLLTVGLLNVLMLAGLLAFVLATGRLDQAKATVMLDLVRHPGTPEGLRDKVARILEPKAAPTTATAPASQPLIQLRPDGGLATIASASDRIKVVQDLADQERQKLEGYAQELLKLQNLLERQRAEVDQKLQAVQKERKAFEDQLRATQAKATEESFTKTLELYNELKPKQVKDLFLKLKDNTVADYLRAMDPERATRIIGEFKTEDERAFISGILEKIRTTGMTPALGPDAAPATQPAGLAHARS